MLRNRIAAWCGVVVLAAAMAGCAQTDAGITTAVKAQLAADDAVPTQEIEVATEDGVVTLTGAVETEVARARAVEIARETDGVLDVSDQLQVMPGPAATTGIGDPARDPDPEIGVRTTDPQWREQVEGDAAVTASVNTALMEDTTLSRLRIDVSTKDNVVTLTGTVPSASEKNRAIELARETEGVKSVVDRLRIESR